MAIANIVMALGTFKNMGTFSAEHENIHASIQRLQHQVNPLQQLALLITRSTIASQQ